MRVNGQVVALDVPIVVHDMSRSGFAVASYIAFEPGQTLDFRLDSPPDLTIVSVSAEAVHTRRIPGAAEMYLTGFKFVAGPLIGSLPQASIDRLMEAITTPAEPVLL